MVHFPYPQFQFAIRRKMDMLQLSRGFFVVGVVALAVMSIHPGSKESQRHNREQDARTELAIDRLKKEAELDWEIEKAKTLRKSGITKEQLDAARTPDTRATHTGV
jgi:hypothetical protein